MIRRLLTLGLAAALIAPPAWAAPADFGPPDGWQKERVKLEDQRRIPIAAAGLNAILPGIGAAYQGDYIKAGIEAGGAFAVLLGSYLISNGIVALTNSRDVAVIFSVAPYAAYVGWAVADGYYSTALANERIDQKIDALTPLTYHWQIATF
ncbi:MAG: hypothetical protein H7338_23705 [Candidatus Sericytochromatia bacterium]|nr:hypothetical protein [Candidatus Sericytochromatia bacterium]